MPEHRTRLQQSFIDAEALEMIRSFNLLPYKKYELMERQDDYYITLICRMCRLLEELFIDDDKERISACEANLIDVAKGLIVYSNEKTQEYFKGVNKINNALFIAAIYYVCQYEAIASFILRKYNINNFKTRAGRKIFYVICCPNIDKAKYDKYAEIEFLDTFINDGDENTIENEIARLKNPENDEVIESPREYFDTLILVAVLKKFLQHNLWTTLKHFDNTTDWHRYIQFSKEVKHIMSFLQSQEDAIKKGVLSYSRSFCLGMATSAGKSYMTTLVIYQELQRNPRAKILYLAPLRSLSRELNDDFKRIKDILGFKPRCNYGGHVSEIGDASKEEAQLFISTPEAFMSEDVYTASFSLVICDEGQLIDDESRGPEYELLLTRLKQLDNIRFLFLSAIIPNLQDVNIWMGGNEEEIAKIPYRPCKQRLGICMIYRGAMQINMYDESYERVNYVIPIEGKYRQVDSRKIKSAVLVEHALQAGTVMTYAFKKQDCEEFGELMIKRGLNCVIEGENYELLRKVTEYCKFQLGADALLVKCLERGFAYHHGDLPQDIRELIEKLLEEKQIRLIICTSTLAEGVNFPIRTLVLAYIHHYDYNLKRKVSLGPEQLKNIVGRVGRAGRELYGTILLPDEKLYKYVKPALQNKIDKPIRGKLYEYVHSIKDVDKWQEDERLVSAIDYTIVKSKESSNLFNIDIQDLAKKTFAYQFCNSDEKQMIIRMFGERCNTLSARFNENTYIPYRNSGLSLPEIDRLLNSLDENFVNDLQECRDCDIPYAIELLIKLTKKVKLPSSVEYNENYPQDIEVICGIAQDWMKGRTYIRIANKRGLNPMQVAMVIREISNTYAYKIQSILSYLVDTNDIKNDRLDNIPIFLQQGIDNGLKAYLLSNRLANRIAVHAMVYLVKENGWSEMPDLEIMTQLKTYRYRLLKDIQLLRIPQLVKERIEEWLKYI